MSEKSIFIATAADGVYAPHTGAMLHSLSESNPDLPVTLFFLHREGLDKKILNKLADQCSEYGYCFKAVVVPSELVAHWPLSGQYPQEAWYRLRLPSLLSELERVIWLDSDLLVYGSIAELWRIDMRGQPLAAVRNALYVSQRPLPEALGISDHRLYFNSGVMVMDLKLMRQEGAEVQMDALARQHCDAISYADQDVLNPLYCQRICELPLAWNLIASSYFNIAESVAIHGLPSYRQALKSPNIVHFTAMKPWLYNSAHPYRNHYLRHRQAAGWGEPIYAVKGLRSWLERVTPFRLRQIVGRMLRGRWRELALIVCP